MKSKFILITALFGAMLSLSSCSDNVDNTDNLENQIIKCRSKYASTNRLFLSSGAANSYSLIFQKGATWDEVIYNKTNPEDYKLSHYEVISETEYLDEDKWEFKLTMDSVYIGDIIAYNSDEVYFRGTDSITSLLYDFESVGDNSIGIGAIDATYALSFHDYKDIPEGSEWTVSTVFYPYIYDDLGGKTIVNFGSTSGFLAPIQPLKANYCREILQAYHIRYNDYIHISNRLLYRNKGTEVSKYLPEDFWLMPHWE